MDHDFDYVIIVDGPTGTGKSSATMHAKMMYDGFYNLDNVLYDAADSIRVMYEAPRGSFILHDEAVCDFMNRTAMDRFQIRLIQAFSIAREMNHVYCLLIPNYNLLDPALRVQAKYRWWIYAKGYERGFMKVFYQKRNEWTKTNPWQDESWHYLFPMLPKRTLAAYKKFKSKELSKKLHELQSENDADRARQKDKAEGIRGKKARMIKATMTAHPKWEPLKVAKEVGCSLKHARDTMRVLGGTE